MRSFKYLLLCAYKQALGRGLTCPSCGGQPGATVDRKYLVTALRRCGRCELLYRTPTTTEEENARFYQSDYEESTTTEMPSDSRLSELIAENFASINSSYPAYIEIIRAFGALPGQRVMDFGCSWGYGSYQMRQAGFIVESFEISQPRATYAREKLGATLLNMEDIQPESFDVFFSSHVIEHVPSVENMLALGERSLRPGGIFVALTPNGSDSHRKEDPKGWRYSWGGVHPQLIDDRFLRRASERRPFFASGCPYPLDQLRNWDGSAQTLSMSGYEILFAFRKPAN
jgi:SAM-dependent methyltransferase